MKKIPYYYLRKLNNFILLANDTPAYFRRKRPFSKVMHSVGLLDYLSHCYFLLCYNLKHVRKKEFPFSPHLFLLDFFLIISPQKSLMGKTQRYLYHNLLCFSSLKYLQNVTQVPSIKRVQKAHRKSSCFLIRFKTVRLLL